MQLMPHTAKFEASQLSHDYLAEERRDKIVSAASKKAQLYHAETNLALGVHHVHRLLQKYKDPILVLTAYNASPRATERWIKNLSTRDMLTFVEGIPYKETKEYVKLVLRNYFYYKRWYHEPSPSMGHIESLVSSDEIKDQEDLSTKVSL
jgi:soluble lytic murein transglycosylase-like protein